ncbi:energy transducer TonB [Myxococcus landrumensis]|uniref:Energy transducer TonB n=1 Tax=Myxococcus landrumensis TaxID=2813577 RepID=A0ABX7NHN0_9BACT|nr:energy transducer TonB [Myxococcus landrumus]QSQ17095.1 energy transducer TonB [Myxococcus landrumus]
MAAPRVYGDVGPMAKRSTEPLGVVSPDEAPVVFAEAAQVLAGKPTEAQVRQALADVSAVCDQTELPQACDYLRENFEPPLRYAGQWPEFPDEVHREGTVVMVVLNCMVGTDGRPRNIEVVESSTKELTGLVVRALAGFRFHPATFAGHPIEIQYALSASSYAQAMNLTPQQELAWGHVRVKTFPKSLHAWAHLSRALARDDAKAPAYEQALRELNFLSPSYWWSATELAWLHAEAGRYEEAAPLAREGRQQAPENAYALETSARVAFHQNRCQEAVQEQRQALAKLPEEWPREERERFERTLADYQRQCAASPSAPVAPGT